jgi:hypothetical protein
VVSRACSLTCQVPFERLAFDLLDGVIRWFRGRVLSLASCRSRDSPSTFSMALFGGFAGVFSHWLRAVRERQRLCYLLDILVECGITTNGNGQSMASRVLSRGLTARDGAGAGTFLGIVAVGSDLSMASALFRSFGKFAVDDVTGSFVCPPRLGLTIRSKIS